MSEFRIYDETNAPADAQPLLAKAKANYGMVPNLLGSLAEAPAALEGYMTLSGIFAKSTLSTEEKHVVLLAIAEENQCTYCVAAHTGLAKGAGVADEIIESLRDDEAINDPKLEVLRNFTKKMVVERGFVGDEAVNAFLDAGFTKANIYEVVLGVGLKVISNYANHIAETPVDAAFAPFKWEAG